MADLLGLIHIAVDMVTDIEDLSPRHIEQSLDGNSVSSLIHLRPLYQSGYLHQVTFLGDHFVVRRLAGKELWLGGIDNDQVKEVTPRSSLRQKGIKTVGHDRSCVLPVRIGDQQQDLIEVFHHLKRLGNLPVSDNVLFRIVQNHSLQRTLSVQIVYCLDEIFVELFVVFEVSVSQIQRCYLTEERAQSEGEERVNHLESRIREGDNLVRVEIPQFFPAAKILAMQRRFHVTEPVYLDQVPQLLIDNQSPDHLIGFELQSLDIIRITQLPYEILYSQLKYEILELFLSVDNEGVVHIEAHYLYGIHIQGSRRIDSFIQSDRNCVLSKHARFLVQI